MGKKQHFNKKRNKIIHLHIFFLNEYILKIQIEYEDQNKALKRTTEN